MRAKFLLTAIGAAIAVVISGCSAPSPTATGGPVRVVASTNVYGDIAKQVGGDRVRVDSIIDNPAQDPHSFEAGAQVQLAISKANLVIENGGGYDDFVGTLLKGANNADATVLNATTISGYHQGGSFNEHLWYDFPTVKRVVAKLVSTLSSLDPAGAETFAANGTTLDKQLGVLEAGEASLKSSNQGAGVAITEPVPLYLLEASGLSNKTPAAFSEAIEQGTDVSPVVLRQTLALFTTHAVKLLAYNEQTSSAETEQVRTAAKRAGVAVVSFTETLPSGTSYLRWMTGNLAALKAALQ
ncbi:metal ABC transporter solute-binding protein, Zn/Mn family [Lacisediminihabitans profunda]|uniref:ABC transporter substrate-binding protein n=1 Tax=Lacisediminihabitans profunda TaxID=2594790 RepID=A0A5C8ULN5_9MICO|nr:zinc ABC transporter substrate-binding protein [Lacisediminihabitans profunda]TXN29245.1 ABC transporter substrate-binding protein [Lacisediminihabitans profunda]